MGKNYSDNLHSIKNAEDLTMKQMFDVSEKLISEQSDEIYGKNTSNWADSSWKHLSLCLGKMDENPPSNYAWEDRLVQKFIRIQSFGHK